MAYAVCSCRNASRSARNSSSSSSDSRTLGAQLIDRSDRPHALAPRLFIQLERSTSRALILRSQQHSFLPSLLRGLNSTLVPGSFCVCCYVIGKAW